MIWILNDIILMLVIGSFLSIQILCIYWMMLPGKESKLLQVNKGEAINYSAVETWPKVSLLLAARNEEQLILRSLKAIEALDYPEDKLEILIGNDASTDSTRSLVLEFIKERPKFKLFDIEKKMGKGRGKANVLAHLAHEANGEIYLITDVDVQLPKNWVMRMVLEFEDEDVGIVSGTSMCERSNFFSMLQSVDWLHFMGYIKAFAKVGVSCTSVGNNMAVRAKAYWETGGYEHIDFSITEDYKLFKEVTSRSWRWRSIMDPDSLGKAWYISSIAEMLHQRKRWLIGARELPLNWKSMIVLYGMFVPALIFLAFFNPLLAFKLWFVKAMLQVIFIHTLCIRVGERPFSFLQLLVYEIYVLLNTVATAIFYFLPIKSVWKGRIYNAEYLKDS